MFPNVLAFFHTQAFFSFSKDGTCYAFLDPECDLKPQRFRHGRPWQRFMVKYESIMPAKALGVLWME